MRRIARHGGRVLIPGRFSNHEFPEGLAVGVALGAVAAGYEAASLLAAVALDAGIGLQNWPEGMAVAPPLRREGMSPLNRFFFGQLSAAGEPVAGVLGAGAILVIAHACFLGTCYPLTSG